jgi:hypothetical protein
LIGEHIVVNSGENAAILQHFAPSCYPYKLSRAFHQNDSTSEGDFQGDENQHTHHQEHHDSTINAGRTMPHSGKVRIPKTVSGKTEN